MITLSANPNTENPDVSVIIPTYNRISMLEEALASVFSQDFDGIVEIIVIDDNSQDGTSEIISEKYPQICLISLKQNVGCCAARNKALEQAKGKYIACLDSDDLWETNYLQTQITALKNHDNKRCFCVSGLVLWNTVKDQKKTTLQKPDLKKFTSSLHQLLLVGSFISTPSSVVFPRQVFSEVGLFDETYRLSGDNDLYIRCLLAGYRLIFTELPTAICRKHDQGQMTDAKNMEMRRKTKLARVDKFHSSVKKCVDIAPIGQIYAEINKDFASQYFRKNYFGSWLFLSIESGKNANFFYAFSNMINDIRSLLRLGTKMKTIISTFKKTSPI